MTEALERAFPVFARGVLRDDILTSFRVGLRLLTNPETNQPFTEREIAVATAELSRWYLEADAIDLVLLAGQARALFLADQVHPDRASSAWLIEYHARLWGMSPLAAVGGSGTFTVTATVGTVFVGSTTLPDPVASQVTDPAGKLYQVLFTVATPVGGVATVTAKGIDTGDGTNLAIGTVLKGSQNWPLGAAESGAVATAFTGGLAAETDAQFAARLLARIRHKPASGNNAHFRSWARDASVAVEDGFVYACALQAGTTRVAVTQRRGSVLGPTGRIASAGTLTDVTAYLTPPGSSVVPAPPLVVATGVTGVATHLALGLSMLPGQAAGWTDLQPWPGVTGAGATKQTTITTVTSQTSVRITIPAGTATLPSGVTAPSLMVWDDATSRFERLNVLSVVLFGGQVYTVTLSSAPAKTLVVGDYVSPDTARRDLIAETLESYFDSLGPGELVDLATDPRAHRAFRHPEPSETFPQRAGTFLLSWLGDALGAALADATLESISTSTPAVAADPVDPPNLLVAGRVGIYPL